MVAYRGGGGDREFAKSCNMFSGTQLSMWNLIAYELSAMQNADSNSVTYKK